MIRSLPTCLFFDPVSLLLSTCGFFQTGLSNPVIRQCGDMVRSGIAQRHQGVRDFDRISHPGGITAVGQFDILFGLPDGKPC